MVAVSQCEKGETGSKSGGTTRDEPHRRLLHSIKYDLRNGMLKMKPVFLNLSRWYVVRAL